MDTPEKIEIDAGTEVTITWVDGTTTQLTAAALRAACQCASCREPDGLRRTEAVLSGAVPVTISDAKLVGGYALNFVFSPDGHGTGIYPFPVLRELDAP